MAMTLAFDVYGTLVDTQGVTSQLQTLIGDQAREFSLLWRNKQLEYSFRRGLMRRYENFATCISDALTYTCAALNVSLSESEQHSLLEAYQTLPAFDDAKVVLPRLFSAGYRLYAFSNGTSDTVERLLRTTDIYESFSGIVSVDDVQSFKPDPKVYAHLLQATGSIASDTWLISSNSFDVIGALSHGLNSAWVQRSKQDVYDPWGIEPTITVNTLADFEQSIC